MAFLLWELQGITSPCCLLIGQYPHHIIFSSFADLQHRARVAIYVTCSNGIPWPVAMAPGGVALLATGGGFILLWPGVEGQLYLPAHVMDVDHTSILIGGCVVCGHRQ